MGKPLPIDNAAADFPVEIFGRDLGHVLLDPLCHFLLLTEVFATHARGLAVAQRLGRGDEGSIGPDLEVLEGVAGEGALDDLVAHHVARKSLAERRHARGHVLDGRGRSAKPFDARLEPLGLRLGFPQVLGDPLAHFRIVLDAAFHARKHGLGLFLHGMRIAQPLHQSFVGFGPGIRHDNRSIALIAWQRPPRA